MRRSMRKLLLGLAELLGCSVLDVTLTIMTVIDSDHQNNPLSL